MTNSVLKVFSSSLKTSSCLWRQVMATFTSCLLSVTGGVTFGCTAVLLPQLKVDKDFPYDASFDSWIASVMVLAMMCGCLLSGPMSDCLGRRRGQMILIFPFSVGWLVMAFARDNTIMMVGRFITGLCTGAIRPLAMVYIGEISAPKIRSVTLVCPSLAVYSGILFGHIVGHFFYWRISCFIFMVPNVLCLLLLLFLKESPLWLITKGKIDEGITSFKHFRGTDEAAELELKAVLEKQAENESKTSYKDLLGTLMSMAFFKSILSIFLLFVAVQLCGINTISFYAQDIFKSTFHGEVDAFMLMLVTDVTRVVTTTGICLLVNRVPRRATFLVSCYITTFVLIGFLIYIYLKPEGLIWLAITLLVLYIGIASILTCTSWSFVAEIFPSNVRGVGSGIGSLISFFLLFVSVKITPGILANFGDIALYGSFAVVTLFSAVTLTFMLPETNGKSLQEIENKLYIKEPQEIHQTKL